ncbi:MAG: hypothetical protein WAL63_18935 [Solirubrobacteraceae bacterium]
MKPQRRAPATLITALGLALAAASVAGCGSGGETVSSRPSGSSPSATSTASASGLAIAPAVAAATSIVRFSFVAATSAGRHGSTTTAYALAVTGTPRTGCVARHSAAIPAVRGGERVTVALGPSGLGGPWCPGTHTARVTEFARAACSAGEACPQFIRIVTVFGPVSFRVAG